MIITNIRQSFRKLSIKQKLIIFLVTCLLTIGCCNIYFYNKAYSTVQDYNNILKDFMQVNNFSIKFAGEGEYISRYLESKDKADLENYYMYKTSADSLSRIILESSQTKDTYLLSKAIFNSIDSYNNIVNEIIFSPDLNDIDYTKLQWSKTVAKFIGEYSQQLLNNKLAEGDWFYQQLSNRVAYVRLINLISIIFVIFFSIICGLLFSNSISVPLQKLTKYAMRVAAGDYDAKVLDVNNSEEINILTDAFMIMNDSVKNKITLERKIHEDALQIIKISDQLNESRFLALQSQINPHFLFNTLNIIMRIAMFEKAKKTSDLISSLSNIFRYNLGTSKKEVLLEDELQIIKEYIHIQKVRFVDRLDFSVVCNTDISQVFIPRFTLQPLVENAIVHGIEPKVAGGKIRIKCIKKENKIVVKVIDNGVGIPPDFVQSLLSNSDCSDNPRGSSTGLGINNVKERLMLYSKNGNCFSIKSKENIGTVITIKL